MKHFVIVLAFGGKSTEHDVSLRSAGAIHRALIALGHQVHCVGIDREGAWRYQGDGLSFPGSVDIAAPLVTIRPGQRKIFFGIEGQGMTGIEVDVLFPALHGRWGEDGTIQGLAAMCGIPCVGSGVLGSAISMDKDVAKQLLQTNGITVAPWLALSTKPTWALVTRTLGTKIFVKPASSGSSVGVHRVTNAAELARAFSNALEFDDKIILEAEVRGREIECGIVDVKGELIASELGEVTLLGNHKFYDFRAKYEDQDGARLLVPCGLPEKIRAEIQDISRRAFRCLGLATLARVDFFLDPQGNVILNEVNTLPGFTDVSMYPKMFDCSGYSLIDLMRELLESTIAKGGFSL